MPARFALFLLIAFAVPRALPAADAPRRVLGEDGGRVAIVNERGDVEWEFRTGAQSHDLWLLKNGNVLLAASATTVAEVSPSKKVVWKYEAKPVDGYKGRIEIHSFQPLEDGSVMVAESGNRRIVEVNRDGKIVHEIPLVVMHPDAHRDTRLVRKLDNGHYLACHEADATVREYDRTGKVVWSYTIDLGGRPASPGHGPEGHGTSLYSAYRLSNGNTLIGGGNNNRVLEVNPQGEVVWSVDQKELPGVTLAWVTVLHPLPNGNVIIGNCHAGSENPQLIEITRDKQIVWTFKNFQTFGNGLAATRVLDATGDVTNPAQR